MPNVLSRTREPSSTHTVASKTPTVSTTKNSPALSFLNCQDNGKRTNLPGRGLNEMLQVKVPAQE